MIAGGILGVLAVGTAGGGGGGIVPGTPGTLYLLGRNPSDGFGFNDGEWIEGERLPAIFWVFDPVSNNMAYLFQMPRLLFPPGHPDFGDQINDLYPCAWEGSTVISAQIDPASATRYVCLTSYRYNSSVLRYTEWVDTFTDDFPTLIDLGTGFFIDNVIVINPGKFVVKVNPGIENPGSETPTSINIPFVLYDVDPNFSSGFIYELTNVLIDLSALYPEAGWFFMPPGGTNNWAFDTFNSELGISFQITNPGFAGYTLLVKIDTVNFTIVSHQILSGWSPPKSSMSLLTTTTAPANLNAEFENFNGSYSTLSYGSVRVLDPTDTEVKVSTYDARILASGGDGTELVFVDESEIFTTYMPAKIDTAMTNLGFVLANDGSIPKWEHQGFVVPDNAFPVARTQTFRGSLFGYYAWYGWPATDSSGWNSLGLNAGLPTIAAFEGPDAFPSVYGPYLGIGFGFVTSNVADGTTYFVLAARGTYGNERWKITGTGLTAPLFTETAEWGELDVQWPGHYGWAWLVSTSGMPLDWYNDANRFITIQNLDA